MEKEFNITGTCFPKRHYMADVSKKMEKARAMIDKGLYFIINRPRQYGKTTTLNTLGNTLRQTGDYIVFNTSFGGIGDIIFDNEADFSQGFVDILAKYAAAYMPEAEDWLLEIAPSINSLKMLDKMLTRFVNRTDKKVVLMIDEVDKSSNNQLFVSFLAMFRDKYLERETFKTFHSVVLAGVHDVKSLKLKIRPNEEAKLNSPWNIAADFTVDMNLYPFEIKPMLEEYAADRGVKMDIEAIAERLFYHTSGYPFLVSKLCKMLDETYLPQKTEKEWTVEDIDIAARQLAKESNANFDTLVKNLENDEKLYHLIYQIAIDNEQMTFNIHNPLINLGILHGIIVNRNGIITIHNRIYNEVITSYMESKMHQIQAWRTVDFGGGIGYKNDDNSLNMEAVLLGFQAFMKKEYSKNDRDFLEKNGRLVFLAYLKPIINGSGYDFKEVQISEEKRLDVVITYLQYKYVAELKIWRGPKAHDKGLAQLADYLEKQAIDEGFLLIFDHSGVKNWDSKWETVNGKKVFVVWV